MQRRILSESRATGQQPSASKPVTSNVAHQPAPPHNYNEEEEDGDTDARSMRQLVSAGQQGVRAADLREKSAEFSKLRDGLLRSRRAVDVLTGSEANAVYSLYYLLGWCELLFFFAAARRDGLQGDDFAAGTAQSQVRFYEPTAFLH